jgi:hypothetical protein
MDETMQNRINTLTDHLILQLENDIKNCPPEKFDHVAMTIMNLYAMKESVRQGDMQLYAQTELLKKIGKNLDNGNIMFGPPEGW